MKVKLCECTNSVVTHLDNGLYSAILVDLYTGVLCDYNDGGLLAQDGELVVTDVSGQYIHAASLLITRERIVGSIKGVHVRPSKDHGSTCIGYNNGIVSSYFYRGFLFPSHNIETIRVRDDVLLYNLVPNDKSMQIRNCDYSN